MFQAHSFWLSTDQGYYYHCFLESDPHFLDYQTHFQLPHCNDSIPSTWKHCRWKYWMPDTTYSRPFLMCSILLKHSMAINKGKTWVSNSEYELFWFAAKWTYLYLLHSQKQSFPSQSLLISLNGKSITPLIYSNMIVQTLSGYIISGGMKCHNWHWVHGRIWNVFDWDTNIPYQYPIPTQKTFCHHC